MGHLEKHKQYVVKNKIRKKKEMWSSFGAMLNYFEEFFLRKDYLHLNCLINLGIFITKCALPCLQCLL